MISKKTKYALKALTLLAEEYPARQPVLISKLAQRGRIPKKFLELILLELRNQGMLQSKMGKGGGYFLAKPPQAIKIGTVMRTIEGPLSPLPCLSRTAYRRCEECADEEHCLIRLAFKEIHEYQTSILDGMSLQDMLDQCCEIKNTGTYAI